MGNVSSVSTVAYREQKSIVSHLTDSVSYVRQSTGNYKDTTHITDTLRYKVFHYHDEFYDVYGQAHEDQQTVHISSRDTMMQVVFRKRKTPWLWIFSPKVLEQRVYFKNPDAHIQYSRTINITK